MKTPPRGPAVLLLFAPAIGREQPGEQLFLYLVDGFLGCFVGGSLVLDAENFTGSGVD